MYFGTSVFVIAIMLIYIIYTYAHWKKSHTLNLTINLNIMNGFLFVSFIVILLCTVIFSIYSSLTPFSVGIALYYIIYSLSYLYQRFIPNIDSKLGLLGYSTSLLFSGFVLSEVANSFYYGGDAMVFEVLVMTTAAVCAGAFPFVLTKIASMFTRVKKHKHSHNLIQKTSKDMMQHYKKHGLDHNEIDYFRQHMAHAKEHIITLDKNFQQTAKLRAIETRNNTVKVSQSFFKDIVNHPHRLPDANQFILRFLPSLVDLTNKYNEINNHVAKNKQTYQILKKSAQTIDLVCQQITDEYIVFHKNEYNELSDEVQLAQLNIQRRSQSVEDATIDDIIEQELGGQTHDK